MCKSFWSILVCYYQVTMWHQNVNLFEKDLIATSATSAVLSESTTNYDEYIQQKFKNGQSRIWNDIQSKCCVYLASTKLHNLKYEQFIQVLSIVQRLKKVGIEFCGEQSANLMESMRLQSMSFFKRYHASSLEEICLFLDNEAWVPVASFSSIVQLQVRVKWKVTANCINLLNSTISGISVSEKVITTPFSRRFQQGRHLRATCRPEYGVSSQH